MLTYHGLILLSLSISLSLIAALLVAALPLIPPACSDNAAAGNKIKFLFYTVASNTEMHTFALYTIYTCPQKYFPVDMLFCPPLALLRAVPVVHWDTAFFLSSGLVVAAATISVV